MTRADLTFVKAMDGDGFDFLTAEGHFIITLDRTPAGSIRRWHARCTRTQQTYAAKTRADLKQQLEDVLACELSPEQLAAIKAEVKMMLATCRRSMKARGMDAVKWRFDATNGYYGEAFGILRGLVVLGYMEYGAMNVGGTAQHLLHECEEEVLAAEVDNPLTDEMFA